jgi:thiamine kinase-like enzyme
MMPKKFTKQVSALLKNADYQGPFELNPMSGGKNNRVYLAKQSNRIIGVLKQYYHQKEDLRDRLNSEWRFSEFLWNTDIRQIPEPVVSDPSNHIALYRFINGKKLIPERITKAHIDQAIDFYFSINSFRLLENARSLPDASEACFSLGEHIRLIDRRILNLKNIKSRSEMDKKAREFIDRELMPVWETVRTATFTSAHDNGFSLNEAIPFTNRRLSPSDFGFHNALEDNNGRLFFMDFEYAGWDDPAKMVCDFFCQPAIPVPQQYFPTIIEKIVRELGEPDIQRQRIELLYPIYQIKWCCIVLNEFLPWGRSRRLFMDTTSDSEKIKEGQLRKARDIIQNVSQKL